MLSVKCKSSVSGQICACQLTSNISVVLSTVLEVFTPETEVGLYRCFFLFNFDKQAFLLLALLWGIHIQHYNFQFLSLSSTVDVLFHS